MASYLALFSPVTASTYDIGCRHGHFSHVIPRQNGQFILQSIFDEDNDRCTPHRILLNDSNKFQYDISIETDQRRFILTKIFLFDSIDDNQILVCWKRIHLSTNRQIGTSCRLYQFIDTNFIILQSIDYPKTRKVNEHRWIELPGQISGNESFLNDKILWNIQNGMNNEKYLFLAISNNYSLNSNDVSTLISANQPTVTLRHLEGNPPNSSNFLGIVGKGLVKAEVNVLGQYLRENNRFFIKYHYQFLENHFNYLLKEDGNEMERTLKIIRICNYDLAFLYSYTELKLQCQSYDSIDHIFYSKSLRRLFILFQLNGQQDLYYWDLDEINRTFLKNLQQCYHSGGSERGLNFLRPPQMCMKQSMLNIDENYCSVRKSFLSSAKNYRRLFHQNQGNYHSFQGASPFSSRKTAHIFPVIGTRVSCGRKLPIQLSKDEKIRNFFVEQFKLNDKLKMMKLLGATENNQLIIYHWKNMNWNGIYRTTRLNLSHPIYQMRMMKSGKLFIETNRTGEEISLFNCSTASNCDECQEHKEELCGWCVSTRRCSLMKECEYRKFWLNRLNEEETICPNLSLEREEMSRNSRQINFQLTLPKQFESIKWNVRVRIDKDEQYEVNEIKRLNDNSYEIDISKELMEQIKQNEISEIQLNLFDRNSSYELIVSPPIKLFDCRKLTNCKECNSHRNECSFCAGDDTTNFQCLEKDSCFATRTFSSCPFYNVNRRHIWKKMLTLTPNNRSISIDIPQTSQHILTKFYRSINFYVNCLSFPKENNDIVQVFDRRHLRGIRKLTNFNCQFNNSVLEDSRRFGISISTQQLSGIIPRKRMGVMLTPSSSMEETVHFRNCSDLAIDCYQCHLVSYQYSCEWKDGTCQNDDKLYSSKLKLCEKSTIYHITPTNTTKKGGTIIEIFGKNLQPDMIDRILLGGMDCNKIGSNLSSHLQMNENRIYCRMTERVREGRKLNEHVQFHLKTNKNSNDSVIIEFDENRFQILTPQITKIQPTSFIQYCRSSILSIDGNNFLVGRTSKSNIRIYFKYLDMSEENECRLIHLENNRIECEIVKNFPQVAQYDLFVSLDEDRFRLKEQIQITMNPLLKLLTTHQNFNKLISGKSSDDFDETAPFVMDGKKKIIERSIMSSYDQGNREILLYGNGFSNVHNILIYLLPLKRKSFVYEEDMIIYESYTERQIEEYRPTKLRCLSDQLCLFRTPSLQTITNKTTRAFSIVYQFDSFLSQEKPGIQTRYKNLHTLLYFRNPVFISVGNITTKLEFENIEKLKGNSLKEFEEIPEVNNESEVLKVRVLPDKWLNSNGELIAATIEDEEIRIKILCEVNDESSIELACFNLKWIEPETLSCQLPTSKYKELFILTCLHARRSYGYDILVENGISLPLIITLNEKSSIVDGQTDDELDRLISSKTNYFPLVPRESRQFVNKKNSYLTYNIGNIHFVDEKNLLNNRLHEFIKEFHQIVNDGTIIINVNIQSIYNILKPLYKRLNVYKKRKINIHSSNYQYHLSGIEKVVSSSSSDHVRVVNGDRKKNLFLVLIVAIIGILLITSFIIIQLIRRHYRRKKLRSDSFNKLTKFVSNSDYNTVHQYHHANAQSSQVTSSNYTGFASSITMTSQSGEQNLRDKYFPPTTSVHPSLYSTIVNKNGTFMTMRNYLGNNYDKTLLNRPKMKKVNNNKTNNTLVQDSNQSHFNSEKKKRERLSNSLTYLISENDNRQIQQTLPTNMIKRYVSRTDQKFKCFNHFIHFKQKQLRRILTNNSFAIPIHTSSKLLFNLDSSTQCLWNWLEDYCQIDSNQLMNSQQIEQMKLSRKLFSNESFSNEFFNYLTHSYSSATGIGGDDPISQDGKIFYYLLFLDNRSSIQFDCLRHIIKCHIQRHCDTISIVNANVKFHESFAGHFLQLIIRLRLQELLRRNHLKFHLYYFLQFINSISNYQSTFILNDSNQFFSALSLRRNNCQLTKHSNSKKFPIFLRTSISDSWNEYYRFERWIDEDESIDGTKENILRELFLFVPLNDSKISFLLERSPPSNNILSFPNESSSSSSSTSSTNNKNNNNNNNNQQQITDNYNSQSTCTSVTYDSRSIEYEKKGGNNTNENQRLILDLDESLNLTWKHVKLSASDSIHISIKFNFNPFYQFTPVVQMEVDGTNVDNSSSSSSSSSGTSSQNFNGIPPSKPSISIDKLKSKLYNHSQMKENLKKLKENNQFNDRSKRISYLMKHINYPLSVLLKEIVEIVMEKDNIFRSIWKLIDNCWMEVNPNSDDNILLELKLEIFQHLILEDMLLNYQYYFDMIPFNEKTQFNLRRIAKQFDRSHVQEESDILLRTSIVKKYKKKMKRFCSITGKMEETKFSLNSLPSLNLMNGHLLKSWLMRNRHEIVQHLNETNSNYFLTHLQSSIDQSTMISCSNQSNQHQLDHTDDIHLVKGIDNEIIMIPMSNYMAIVNNQQQHSLNNNIQMFTQQPNSTTNIMNDNNNINKSNNQNIFLQNTFQTTTRISETMENNLNQPSSHLDILQPVLPPTNANINSSSKRSTNLTMIVDQTPHVDDHIYDEYSIIQVASQLPKAKGNEIPYHISDLTFPKHIRPNKRLISFLTLHEQIEQQTI
ncbi:hypothetical protein SNEBB_001118 [Seison nebaliae]|nr:hypothetical protein SNEBB_001118 [Seison nebaliae]